MTTFLDTNVLIYLADPKSEFYKWAQGAIQDRLKHGPLVICDITYSEFSVAMPNRADTDTTLNALGIQQVTNLSRDALYSAGQACKTKKSMKDGTPRRILPDFFVGAAAADEGAALITNNSKDFLPYFPDITYITPAP